MSPTIIDFIRKREYCRRVSISQKRTTDERLTYQNLYREFRNEVKYALRDAKAKFFREKLTAMHKCPSKFWNTINQISESNRVSSLQLPPIATLGRQFSSVVGTIETAEFNSSQSQKQFQGSTNLSYFSTITQLEVCKSTIKT